MDTNEEKVPFIMLTMYEQGLPILWRFWRILPSPEVINARPLLVRISWEYGGSEHNGMPHGEVDSNMNALEEALYSAVEYPGYCNHAYNRTGRNLKQFGYYTDDRDRFLKCAEGLSAQYPITIEFEEDNDWTYLRIWLKFFKDLDAKSGT